MRKIVDLKELDSVEIGETITIVEDGKYQSYCYGGKHPLHEDYYVLWKDIREVVSMNDFNKKFTSIYVGNITDWDVINNEMIKWLEFRIKCLRKSKI